MMWVGDWTVHWVWMVVAWAVVIGLVAWASARLAPSDGGRRPSSARALLDERYARGELDDNEYRQRRGELDG